MLNTLRRAFRVPDLRRRIMFTFYMLLVFRLGTHVPVPGIDPSALKDLFGSGSLFGLLDMFSGGAFSSFSIFAMSITPYINASIIMNLLTVVIPTLERWSKEGEEGRRKISQWTRYGTVALALVQAIGMSFFMRSAGALAMADAFGLVNVVITLTAGTIFLMWLGEQITDHGVGNGISLLIFGGIVSRVPGGAINLFVYVREGTVSIVNIVVLLVLGLLVIAGVVFVEEGRRRVPVRYSKRVIGRKMYGGQSTHIPMRINQAGVIPVIFASSVLAFPPTIAQFIPASWAQSLAQSLDYGTGLHTVLYFTLIVFFTYFYTAVTFNPQDVAENIRKYGGFIPGRRPGRATAEYLDRVLVRITLPGALFLATIAVFPNFFGGLTGVPGIFFGGTALLIVVGVALETMKQIEAQLLMRQYEGFMR
ncbi:MAG: preprotein translocase subunit SecY [Bacillota bacterium]